MIVVLVLFIGYQSYRIALAPTPGLVALTVFGLTDRGSDMARVPPAAAGQTKARDVTAQSSRQAARRSTGGALGRGRRVGATRDPYWVESRRCCSDAFSLPLDGRTGSRPASYHRRQDSARRTHAPPRLFARIQRYAIEHLLGVR